MNNSDLNGSKALSTNSLFIYVVSTNHGEFVEDALKSLLNQTNLEFTLFLIDNACIDETAAIYKRYADRFENASIVTLDKRQRLQAIANLALRACKETFMMRLDADDFLHEEAVERLRAGMHEKIDIIYGDFVYVDRASQPLGEHRRFSLGDRTVHDEPAHGACTALRTARMREIGGWRTEFTCQDGFDVWLRLYDGSNIIHIPSTLFYYRQLPTSLSFDRRRIFDTRVQMVQRHAEEVSAQVRNLTLILMPLVADRPTKMQMLTRAEALIAEIRAEEPGHRFALGFSASDAELVQGVAPWLQAETIARNEREAQAVDFFPFLERVMEENRSTTDYLTVVTIEKFTLSSDYVRVAAHYLNAFRGKALLSGCRLERNIFVPRVGGVRRLNDFRVDDDRRYVVHHGGLFTFDLSQGLERSQFIVLETVSPL